MEAPANGHVYKDDLHRAGLSEVIEGEGDHHEKKSVLQKMKNKAKKIKDTLSKKMHHNGDDKGQGYEELEEDNEVKYDDDEDEKMEEDPVIHEAAGNGGVETGVIRPEQPERNAQLSPGSTPSTDHSLPENPQAVVEKVAGGLGERHDEEKRQANVTDSRSTGGVETGVIPPFQHVFLSEQSERAEEYSTTESHGQLSPVFTPSTDHSLAENPRAVGEKDVGGVEETDTEEKGQTNVTDSGTTGGVEPGVIPSFHHVSVSERDEEYSTTGSHGQLSPDFTPSAIHSLSENPQAVVEKDATEETNVTDSESTGGAEPRIIPSFENTSISEQPERAEEYSTTRSIGGLSPDSTPSTGDSLSENPQTDVTDSESTGEVEPGVIRSFEDMSVSEQPEGAEEYSTATRSIGELSPDSTPSTDDSLSENPQAVIVKDAGGVGERQPEEKYSESTGGLEPGVIRSFEHMSVSEQPEEYSTTESIGELPPDSTPTTDHSLSENPQAAVEKDAGGVDHSLSENPRAVVEKDVGGVEERHAEEKRQSNVIDSGSTGGVESGVDRSASEQPERPEEYSTTGSHGELSPDSTPPTNHSLLENPQAVVEKDAGRVGEGYAEEKRSSATSAIVDKGASEKDTPISEAWGSTEYGKNASTDDEKVAGAGTPALAEVQPGNTGMGGDKKGQQDKGSSVKEFLAEKLSPGEEDRALCEVISGEKDGKVEPIQKPREEAEELVSGSGSASSERNVGDSPSPTGEGMVSKIKGAVTSLFYGGGASHAAPESGVQTGGAVNPSSEKQDVQQLQESAN